MKRVRSAIDHWRSAIDHWRSACLTGTRLTGTAPLGWCGTAIGHNCITTTGTATITSVVSASWFAVNRQIESRVAVVSESVPNVDIACVGAPVLIESRRWQSWRRVGLAIAMCNQFPTLESTTASARITTLLATLPTTGSSGNRVNWGVSRSGRKIDHRGSGNGVCRSLWHRHRGIRNWINQSGW